MIVLKDVLKGQTICFIFWSLTDALWPCKIQVWIAKTNKLTFNSFKNLTIKKS